MTSSFSNSPPPLLTPMHVNGPYIQSRTRLKQRVASVHQTMRPKRKRLWIVSQLPFTSQCMHRVSEHKWNCENSNFSCVTGHDARQKNRYTSVGCLAALNNTPSRQESVAVLPGRLDSVEAVTGTTWTLPLQMSASASPHVNRAGASGDSEVTSLTMTTQKTPRYLRLLITGYTTINYHID